MKWGGQPVTKSSFPCLCPPWAQPKHCVYFPLCSLHDPPTLASLSFPPLSSALYLTAPWIKLGNLSHWRVFLVSTFLPLSMWVLFTSLMCPTQLSPCLYLHCHLPKIWQHQGLGWPTCHTKEISLGKFPDCICFNMAEQSTTEPMSWHGVFLNW